MSKKIPTGWSIEAWCESIGISDRMFYDLPPELKPESVKLRTRRIISEPPSAYLKRIATLQREAA